MNINFFMNLAIKEAEKAYLLNEIPIGAILVDNKTHLIISSAHNETIKQKNSIKHADTSIFVTLEPCAMCAAAISEVRIDKIYFGAYDEKKGSLDSIMKIYNTKNYFIPEIYGGINEIECSTILKKFFKKMRK